MADILTSDWSLSLTGLAALALVTLALIVVYARAQNAAPTRKLSKSTRTVVLTGPMAGGKTAVFSKVSWWAGWDWAAAQAVKDWADPCLVGRSCCTVTRRRRIRR